MNRKTFQELISNQEFDKALTLVKKDITKIECQLYKVMQYQKILKKLKNKN
tara:strand:+ start:96 stop:248 length:153 start_codon:yes stop_codon:yes gene_type:complete